MTRPTRTLLFSTLYPSEVRPIHGIFGSKPRRTASADFFTQT